MEITILSDGPGNHLETTIATAIFERRGVDSRVVFSSDLGDHPDGVLCLVGKSFKQPQGRVIDGRVVKIPAIGKSQGDDLRKAQQLVRRAAIISSKIALGMPLTVPHDFAVIDWRTLEKAMSQLNGDEVISVDIETTGLDPKIHEITHVGVEAEGWNKIAIIQEEPWEVMRLLHECGHPLLVCSAKFEQKWFYHKFGSVANVVHDVQVDHALLFEEYYHALEMIAGSVDGYGYDSEMQDFLNPVGGRVKKPSPSNPDKMTYQKLTRQHHEAPDELMYSYLAQDVRVTLKAWNKTTKLLNKFPPQLDARAWLVRAQSCLARMEYRGMKIDLAAALEVQNDMREEFEQAEKIIADVATEHGFEKFNVSSSPQRAKLMYECLDYPVLRLTNKRYMPYDKQKKNPNWWRSIPGASPSTDGDTLLLLSEALPDDEFISAVRRVGQLKNTLDGIVKRCVSSASSTGFMCGSFNLVKLVTGQLSSTDPPMMNVAKNHIRRAFVSRFEGGKLIEADYSQLHLRIIGNLAKCKGFIEAYTKDIDLHARTAAGVMSKHSEKEILKGVSSDDEKFIKLRKNAKQVNFSIIFEIGSRELARKIGQSEHEARDVIKAFYAKYPEIYDFIQRCHDTLEEKGCIVSKMGRVRHLPDAQTESRGAQFRAFRQGTEFSVSNIGRYFTLYSMTLLDEEMERRKMKSCLVCQVHDSIIVDTCPGEEEEVLELIEWACKDQMHELFDFMQPIPLTLEGFIGDNWYQADADEEFEIK